MSKQSITFLKTQNFIRTYPIILFFQHNNLSVKQWFQLRIKLKKFENVDLLFLKNTIIEIVLIQEDLSEKTPFHSKFFDRFTPLNTLKHYTPSLFQGPCFALGFSDYSQFNDLVKITKQSPGIFLIGGMFNNQLINHLEITKLLKLDEKVHYNLVSSINQSEQLQNTLLDSFQSPSRVLNQVSFNLITCLEIFKRKCQD